MAGGHDGFVIAQRPRHYPEEPQQRRIKAANRFCGIRKGMTRSELLSAMTECIPEYFKKLKNGEIEEGEE